MDLNLYSYIIVVIFGLIIGSFLNVVILRFDEIKTILKTRSHCPHCKKEIAWYDLFPFFSYILLSGKCRACKASISVQYPLVELGTALIFGLLFWRFGISLQFFTMIIISAILVIIFTYDILHYLVADILVWLAIGLWAIYLAISYFFLNSSSLVLLNSLYGGLALGGFLGLLVLISKEKWMGAGDIKLGFLLGALMSWPAVLLGSFSAFSLGAVVGISLMFAHKKKMKDMLPFAPFLILGTYVAIFYGKEIISWYLNSIGYYGL